MCSILLDQRGLVHREGFPQAFRGFTDTGSVAGAVVLDSSLTKVDEFLHVGHRMRTIALQSAVSGMTLSVVGMALAAGGLLAPVAGAICQEIIDILAVVNALRAAMAPRHLADIEEPAISIISETALGESLIASQA